MKIPSHMGKVHGNRSIMVPLKEYLQMDSLLRETSSTTTDRNLVGP
jgi:hypothetical protein